ncbi:Pup--protein ligase [Agilicoccus flavus]|uniref:Pup--protein ligase n=1 Tax=Agilicoccus flavus TaxID=2775968 RepID=UPI001CF66980|nr:Pup--protein ligase [Agilicoccus flavus]
MDRRIFGIETEYGVTATHDGRRRLSPDEVARYMFRGIVAWGRSSNVFLPNGARLYLDVGNHPEYATAECDRLLDLVAQDRAGQAIMNTLVAEATQRMRDDGLAGSIYLFKNNVDSAGNSYGCHENYLVSRATDLARLGDLLVPFLMSRQIICGAGHLAPREGGARFCLSQRADVMWEGASSATTRSRPMINTRDEPHADAELYRRLHVIVGDSNMSETTTWLKVGATDLVLRLLETGEPMPDLGLANPPKAIRAISHDPAGRARVGLVDGRELTGVQIQREYQERAAALVARTGAAAEHDEAVLELWDRALTAVETGDLTPLARDVDWVVKQRLLDGYASKHGLGPDDPRLAQLDLTFHDIDPDRGVFGLYEKRGRVSRVVDDAAVRAAVEAPPATTRAALRGAFVSAARAAGRDYTVDWTHLRLNDGSPRTVPCKDPFAAQDDRVDRLLAQIAGD